MLPCTLSLKNSTGWLAAGEGFGKALHSLSDGSFKLLAYLSLEADRRTGRVQATHKELAIALNKSRRAIRIYATELRRKGICSICSAKNQHSKTIFEICDDYWPYQREPWIEKELTSYVAAIRESFIALGCTTGRFGPGDVRTAENFERRGIPLETVQDAMLMGACRKYASWLNGGKSAPIGSLSYFKALVAEMQDRPLPPAYREYYNMQARKLALIWKQQLWMERRVRNAIAARDEDDFLTLLRSWLNLSS